MLDPKPFLAVSVILALPAATLAQSCPSVGGGASLTYTAESVWSAQSSSVVAGGSVNLQGCGSVPGQGYVAQNPDFTIQYNDLGMGRQLDFRVEADCDTVMLVNASDGQWYFDDDTDGLNPAMRLSRAPSGQYDVWVGTVGTATCNARLIVESF